MQILRFESPQLKAIYGTPSAKAQPAEDTQELDAVVPPPYQQSWNVEGINYRSTRELVSRSQSVNGLQATFDVKERPDPPAPKGMKRIGAAVGSGVALSLMGAVGGAACSMFLGLGNLFDSVISLGATSGNGPSALTCVGVGAALSGLAGVIVGYFSRPESPVRTLSGSLRLEPGLEGRQALAFYPNDDVKKRVDLTAAQTKHWWKGADSQG